MATIIGPQQSDFWASHPIEAFHGAPLCLECWMFPTLQVRRQIVC